MIYIYIHFFFDNKCLTILIIFDYYRFLENSVLYFLVKTYRILAFDKFYVS